MNRKKYFAESFIKNIGFKAFSEQTSKQTISCIVNN